MWNMAKFVVMTNDDGYEEPEIHISPSNVVSFSSHQIMGHFVVGEGRVPEPIKCTIIVPKIGKQFPVRDSLFKVNIKLSVARWCDRFLFIVIAVIVGILSSYFVEFLPFFAGENGKGAAKD